MLVALAERLPVVALVAAGVHRRGGDRDGQRRTGAGRAPRGRRGAELVAAVPLPGGRRARRRPGGGSGFDVVFQEDTRYHHLAVVDDGESSRYLPRFDNSFQSGMTIGRPFETRFRYTDYSAVQPGRPERPLRRPRRRLRAEALLARLPLARPAGRRARPGRRRRRPAVLRDAGPPAPQGRRGGRPPLPAAERAPLRRDRTRRVLLRLDPVPPRDPRVRRARARPARAGRRRRRERDRLGRGARLEALPAPSSARTGPRSRRSRSAR